MGKLTDKEKKIIIAEYIESQNYSEVARKHNISNNAVKKIVLKDEDSSKRFKQKCEENTEEVLEAMKKRNKKKIELIDKIFNAMDGKLNSIDMFTNIKDLATAYGIIIDKELKLEELKLKNKELNKENAEVHRIQIINDLPKDDLDGTSQD